MAVFLNLLAGAGIGFLIGLLVSLSNAPVVAATTSVLVTGALVFLSMSKGQQARDTNNRALGRLVGFSISAVVALLLGIYLRAHNSLGQSSSAMLYRELVQIGVLPDDARKAVLASISPVRPAEKSDTGSDKQVLETRKLNSTSLFSVEASQTSCESLDPRKFKTYADVKARFAVEGADWIRATNAAEAAVIGHPEADVKSVLTGIFISICSKR